MPLPPLTSHKQIIFPSPAVAQLLDDIVTNAMPFPANGKTGIIIYGPPGTGKTSLMRLLPDPMEIARSGQLAFMPNFYAIVKGSRTAAICNSINIAAQTIPLHGTNQYFLLDEADNLGQPDLNSLRSVMSNANCIFLFTTNDLSAFPKAVISRSHLIDMTPPPPAAVLGLVQQALSNAGVAQAMPDRLLIDMIGACGGDLREVGAEIDKIIRDMTHF